MGQNKAAFLNLEWTLPNKEEVLESASGLIQRDFSTDMKFYRSFHNLGATRCLYTHRDPHCDGK